MLHCIQSNIKRSIVWSVLSSSLSSALSLLKSNMEVSTSALSSFRNLQLIRKSKGIQRCIFRYKSLSAYEGWLLYSTDEACVGSVRCVCNIKCKQRVTEKQRVILQVIQGKMISVCTKNFSYTNFNLRAHNLRLHNLCFCVFGNAPYITSRPEVQLNYKSCSSSEITQNRFSYYSDMFALVMSSSRLICEVRSGQARVRMKSFPY